MVLPTDAPALCKVFQEDDRYVSFSHCHHSDTSKAGTLTVREESPRNQCYGLLHWLLWEVAGLIVQLCVLMLIESHHPSKKGTRY